MSGPRVAVIGSREFPDAALVRRYVHRLPLAATVVSGGARGVDTWAVEEAGKRGMAVDVIPADWEKHGKKAGPMRNQQIVDSVDMLMAFWYGSSRGTRDAVERAKKAYLPHGMVLAVKRGGSIRYDILCDVDNPSNLYLPEKEES